MKNYSEFQNEIVVAFSNNWFVKPNQYKVWGGNAYDKVHYDYSRFTIHHKYLDLNAHVTIKEWGNYRRNGYIVVVESLDYSYKGWDKRKNADYTVKKVFKIFDAKHNDIAKFVLKAEEAMKDVARLQKQKKADDAEYAKKQLEIAEQIRKEQRKHYDFLDSHVPGWKDKKSITNIIVPNSYSNEYYFRIKTKIENVAEISRINGRAIDINSYNHNEKTIWVQAYVTSDNVENFLKYAI